MIPPTTACSMVLLATFLPFLPLKAAPTEVDHNIQLIEKWIAVNKDTAKLRSDWVTDKAELEQENSLLDSEIESLQKKLEALNSINNELITRERTASDSAEGQDRILDLLKESSEKYESTLLKLAKRLPTPLAADIHEKLGDASARESKNIGARFQAIISAINLIHRFNQKPFFAKEIYESGPGTDKQLDTLYWGIAIGYRVDPSNSIAQIGRPLQDAWVWSDASSYAENIRRLIHIHQLGETPSYVELPLQCTDE